MSVVVERGDALPSALRDEGEDDAVAELARLEDRVLSGAGAAGMSSLLDSLGYLFDDSLRFHVGFSSSSRGLPEL